jgi:hypothetical protein
MAVAPLSFPGLTQIHLLFRREGQHIIRATVVRRENADDSRSAETAG